MTIVAIFADRLIDKSLRGAVDVNTYGLSEYAYGESGIDLKDWSGLDLIGRSLGRRLQFAVTLSGVDGPYSDMGEDLVIEVLRAYTAASVGLVGERVIHFCIMNEWDNNKKVNYMAGRVEEIRSAFQAQGGWERVHLNIEDGEYYKESYVPVVLRISTDSEDL